MSCLMPGRLRAPRRRGLERVGGRSPSASCDLVERARHDEPEQSRDQRRRRRRSGAPIPTPRGMPRRCERLDARAHRRRDDEAEEEQRDEQLQLPERERERRRSRPTTSVATTALRAVSFIAGVSRRAQETGNRPRRLMVPCGAPQEHDVLGVAAARGRARAAARAGARARGGGVRVLRDRLAGDARRAAADRLGALGAGLSVWRWERTRVVVTTEKLFVVHGTLRRRVAAVRVDCDRRRSRSSRASSAGCSATGRSSPESSRSRSSRTAASDAGRAPRRVAPGACSAVACSGQRDERFAASARRLRSRATARIWRVEAACEVFAPSAREHERVSTNDA